MIRGYEVVYSCPSCGLELASPLSDADKEDSCPHCGCVFRVPGLKDLLQMQATQEAKEQEKAQRQKEEQAKRDEDRGKMQEDAARWAEQEAQRQAQRLIDEQAALEAHEREQYRVLRRPTRSDRLLHRAFRVLKIICAVMVTSSLGIVAYCLFLLLTDHPVLKPMPVAPIVPEFRDYKLALEYANEMAERFRRAGKEPVTPQKDRKEVEDIKALRELLGKHFQGPEIVPLMQTVQDSIDLLMLSDFVTALGRFLAEFDRQFARADQERPSKVQGAVWYTRAFREARDRYEQTCQQVQRENEWRQAEAAGRRQAYILVIAGCTVGLLWFMILPLLVQIEQNTRVLRLRAD